MKRKSWLLALGMAASLLPTAPASAADHRDGAATLTDPSTDVNDVYAWMDASGTSVYLAMTVFPAASKTTSKFSNSAYYVIHTTARATAVTPTPAVSVDITCGFDNAASQNISCWIGDSSNFIYGNASNAAAPLTNSSGISVFAGVRKDHFFFNLDGFNQARKDVKANVSKLKFVAAGQPGGPFCPDYSDATTKGAIDTVAGDLSKAPGGGTATDFFASLNTLAIVLKVPLAMLNKGTAAVPIISVSGATYTKG